MAPINAPGMTPTYLTANKAEAPAVQKYIDQALAVGGFGVAELVDIRTIEERKAAERREEQERRNRADRQFHEAWMERKLTDSAQRLREELRSHPTQALQVWIEREQTARRAMETQNKELLNALMQRWKAQVETLEKQLSAANERIRHYECVSPSDPPRRSGWRGLGRRLVRATGLARVISR